LTELASDILSSSDLSTALPLADALRMVLVMEIAP
jgi:hypothetical protein